MNVNQSQTPTSTTADNDTYLKLLQAEQELTRTRWTVATFFMSISFTIFGFSFQPSFLLIYRALMQITALFIYWFALALYWRFETYREYLVISQKELEGSVHPALKIHEKEEKARERGFWKGFWHRLPSKWLLFGFGVLYAFGVIVLRITGL